jgi:hypothetical protein
MKTKNLRSLIIIMRKSPVKKVKINKKSKWEK